MYLKKLIAHGFKSFADNTTIDFNNDISGIVGPNGSGKSNIVDAVRWVLGEQSMKSAVRRLLFGGLTKKDRKNRRNGQGKPIGTPLYFSAPSGKIIEMAKGPDMRPVPLRTFRPFTLCKKSAMMMLMQQYITRGGIVSC